MARQHHATVFHTTGRIVVAGVQAWTFLIGAQRQESRLPSILPILCQHNGPKNVHACACLRFDTMAVNDRLNATYSETALPTITTQSVRASDARCSFFSPHFVIKQSFFFFPSPPFSLLFLQPPLPQHRHSGLEQSAGCPRCTPFGGAMFSQVKRKH